MGPDGFSRRDLMRLGLLGGAAGILSACGYQGGPTLQALLKRVGRGNDWLGEKLLLSPSHRAPEYPRSKRTRDQDFPGYSILRPYPQTDAAGWALEVGGLVDKPARLTLAMIASTPSTTAIRTAGISKAPTIRRRSSPTPSTISRSPPSTAPPCASTRRSSWATR
jgi:DMSO/TMAO reductase YedYZ molybdopterin-dependent catalytic subunit